jgi:hypothetical protein
MSGGECQAGPSTPTQRKAEDDPEDESTVQKKRAAAKQREWIEYGRRWDRSGFSAEDIDKKICKILSDLNRDSGLGTIRGSHKDCKSLYGDFQFRREWFSLSGLIHNMVGSCPMRDRCRCQCEIKSVKDATTVVLLIANPHTSQDHEEEQDIKYLSHKQKCLVAADVKVAPMQTGKQLLQNIEGSPSKAIDRTLSKSVARMVRKERRSLTSIALEGVEVDNTLGSLVKLAGVLWIENAFKLHKQEECIDLFKPYVIGRQSLASDRTMFLSVATCWDLLSIFRSLAAGYLVQLQCDVTSKASTAALNKLGFGVNMLGGHFAPWTYTLIPAETESEAIYFAAYSASKKATRKLMRMRLCDKEECFMQNN